MTDLRSGAPAGGRARREPEGHPKGKHSTTAMRLIGGEMAGWTDESPASGPLLERLLSLLIPDGSRVLLAGPHALSLVDKLAAVADVSCLVRSQPDALELERHDVTVLCGTLAKLTGTYDTVVALDGVDRLCSPEGPQYDWPETIRTLRRALRPGGALLLMVENELGVHRLVDRTTPTSTHTSWTSLGEFGSKPANPSRLSNQLTAEGLPVTWLAAAWPLPTAPTLAATVQALRDGPTEALHEPPAGQLPAEPAEALSEGALSAAVTSSVAHAYANRPVLADPRRLAATAVRAGLGPELAPAWLVLATRGEATPIDLPDLLTADGPVTALPEGRLVEELLITACLRHDLPELRRVLGLWAQRKPGASFDNLVLDGDTLRLINPARPPREPATVLQGLARTLLTSGYHHPWRAAGDVPALTTILLAVAGLVPDKPTGPDVHVDAPNQLNMVDAINMNNPINLSNPAHHDPTSPSDPLSPSQPLSPSDPLSPSQPGEPHPDPDPGPPPPLSLREHEAQLLRLEERLADAADRIRHTEIELAKREAELRRARLQIDTFSGSVGYRLTRLGARAARQAVRVVRRTDS